MAQSHSFEAERCQLGRFSSNDTQVAERVKQLHDLSMIAHDCNKSAPSIDQYRFDVPKLNLQKLLRDHDLYDKFCARYATTVEGEDDGGTQKLGEMQARLMSTISCVHKSIRNIHHTELKLLKEYDLHERIEAKRAKKFVQTVTVDPTMDILELWKAQLVRYCNKMVQAMHDMEIPLDIDKEPSLMCVPGSEKGHQSAQHELSFDFRRRAKQYTMTIAVSICSPPTLTNKSTVVTDVKIGDGVFISEKGRSQLVQWMSGAARSRLPINAVLQCLIYKVVDASRSLHDLLQSPIDYFYRVPPPLPEPKLIAVNKEKDETERASSALVEVNLNLRNKSAAQSETSQRQQNAAKDHGSDLIDFDDDVDEKTPMMTREPVVGELVQLDTTTTAAAAASLVDDAISVDMELVKPVKQLNEQRVYALLGNEDEQMLKSMMPKSDTHKATPEQPKPQQQPANIDNQEQQPRETATVVKDKDGSIAGGGDGSNTAGFTFNGFSFASEPRSKPDDK